MENFEMSPVLSIIVPVYNVCQYLDECIHSIITQTFNSWELILIDDGSTDDSGAICDRYSAIDGRIKTIHKPNGGLSSARNAGLDIMNGDYVTFIDSDDVLICPDTLDNVMSEFNSAKHVDVVQYDVVFKYRSQFEHKRNYPFKTYNGHEAIMRGYLEQNIHVSSCDKIFKSDVFENVRFPLNQISEDVAIIPDIVANCNALKTTPICGYGYRYREGSISNSAIPYDKIVSILSSYYNYYRNAVSFNNLAALAIEAHANNVWSYLSLIRKHYPEKINDFKSRKLVVRISFCKWIKCMNHISSKSRFKTFIICVLGVKTACRIQDLFTR